MTNAIRMEWTKLHTMRATAWSQLALISSTIALTAVASWRTHPGDCAPRPCTLDTVKVSLTGTYIGQIAVVALAVLAITAEYDAMTIRTTLAACPHRSRVLAAKAGVVAVLSLASGALAICGAYVTARLILPGNGFTVANGYPALLSLTDAPTRRAYLGTIVYLVLVAMLSLGVATILRHTAAAITTVLSLLYVMPIAARFVADPHWQQQIMKYSPMSAGLAIQATQPLDHQPVGPWTGLGILGAYAATTMIFATIQFCLRDTKGSS